MAMNEIECEKKQNKLEGDSDVSPAFGEAGKKSSGGPRTAQGKRASRMNSLKHGMSATTLVAELMGEDRFEEALDEFRAELKPEGAVEEHLVRQLSQAALSVELNMKQYRAVARHLVESIDNLGEVEGLAGGDDGAFVDIVQSIPFGLASRYSSASSSLFQRTLRAFFSHRAQKMAELAAGPGGNAAAQIDSEALERMRDALAEDDGWRGLVRELRYEWVTGAEFDVEFIDEDFDDYAGATFLGQTGVAPDKILRLAVELLADPGAPIAALRERSGIKRRETLIRLARKIRHCGEAKRDWLLESIEGRLRPP